MNTHSQSLSLHLIQLTAYIPMADPLALIHIDFQWAEDTLNLKMTYLLARLRIGIMCSAVIGTATGDVLTRDGIKAELVSARPEELS